MKIGIIQQTNAANRAGNWEKLRLNIEECSRRGAELVVLQELHNGAYFCQTEDTHVFDQAELIPGESTAFFGALARKLGIVLTLSLFEKRAPGVYHNTAVAIERNGSIAGTYRKMHIPDDPGYNEKFYFTPGDEGFQPIRTSVGRLGLMVCWDQWFPEAARLMAMRGAEILIYPTAIGWDPSDTEGERRRQSDAWLTVQRGHAVANALHVVAVNRTGHEPDPSGRTGGINFWGSSFVAGPQGEMMAWLPPDREGVEVVEVNLERTEYVRRIWPFFRDRRIDAYEGLSERFL